MKVVINRKFGGFDLSQEALIELQKRLTPDSEIAINEEVWPDNPEAPSKLFVLWDHEVSTRSNPQLIEVVEELGSRANGSYAALKIVEIPDDVDVVIEEYDGDEWISEVHRTWC
jgi:hypothetical protein